ncbi:hypothetical protein [Amycolatopsis sp. NPDC051903]|uniref:hypothetical protein n=1 Tax=Amycolatopsis sp. NPDC051903 TaxID=3363936 RepID=UPI00378C50E8
MTVLTVIGTVAGLLVLVLGALAPVIVELNDRFPRKPQTAARLEPARKPSPAWGRSALPTH